MTTLAFLDTETTGLDPDRHEVWEIGLILRRGTTDEEWAWHLPVDLAKADPTGLRIGRFYERRSAIAGFGGLASLHRTKYPSNDDGKWDKPVSVKDTAELIARLLDGAHIVGAVPSFDAAFLGPWLRAHGQAATWHYHLIDVEALAAGRLGPAGRPPWKSDQLSGDIGVDPEQFDRHTALGDARWARAIYDEVMGP